MALFDLYRSAGPELECYVCAAREGRVAEGDRCAGCTALLTAAVRAQTVPLWIDEGATFNGGFDLFAGNTPVDGGSATPTRRDLQGWAA